MMTNQLPYLASNANLTTLTIGGNNMGFHDVLVQCIADPFDCRDDSKIDEARSLYTPLKNAYTALKQTAPAARIVVLTYPQIFTNENRIPNFECLGDKGITPQERTWFRSVETALNDTIRSAAGDAGIDVLSIDDAFLGHEICTEDPYVQGYEGLTDPRSFHPNVTGNEIMASALADHLQVAGP